MTDPTQDDPMDELEELLFALPGTDDEENSFLLSELDGYLAGILVAPDPPAQEDWLRPIWGGGDEPFPGDPARGDRLVALVLARKAQIALALMQGDLAYQPPYDVFEPTGEVMWPLWAEGFGSAMELGGSDWEALLDTDDEDLGAAYFGLVMYVAMARSSGRLRGEDRKAYEQAPDVIPHLVETMYRRQRGLPRIVLTRDTPAAVPNAGRNDSCPCGSGRKFKRCCGAE